MNKSFIIFGEQRDLMFYFFINNCSLIQINGITYIYTNGLLYDKIIFAKTLKQQ